MLKSSIGSKIGVVTISMGTLAATFTVDSAREWLEVIAQYAPLVLSGWLLYVGYKTDQAHNNCQKELIKMHKKVRDLQVDVTKLKKGGSDD